MKIQLAQAINFQQLQEAIPDLKPVFQPGSAFQVSDIINLVIKYLFVIAGLLLLFYLIAGGFQLMISANNEKGAAAAKGKITNAVVGFFILFLSFWLVQILEFIFGVNLI